MRYLILSDIHANLEAMEATIAAAGECDAVLVLGDLVGYGADPNAVIERVQSLPNATVIRGNHDKVGAGVDTVDSFNHLARHAISWTATELIPEYRQWLAAMPAGPALIDEVVEICHGSPFDEDAYIFDELDAVRALKVAERPLCLFGHTHYPVTFELLEGAFDSMTMRDWFVSTTSPLTAGASGLVAGAAFLSVATSIRRMPPCPGAWNSCDSRCSPSTSADARTLAPAGMRSNCARPLASVFTVCFFPATVRSTG